MIPVLSCAIMAHPKRADLVEQLQRSIGKQRVVWDKHDDRWDTGRRAMLSYEPECTHHVVVQDDIVPCKDLLEGLRLALTHIPEDAPLCGYIGKYRPEIPFLAEATFIARAREASFITMHTLNWGPLIVVPTSAIPEMVAYGDELTHIGNYDRRLSRYWELERHIRVWYTWPSLVDHRESPSLVPHRPCARPGAPRGYVAENFLGRDRSALKVKWDGPIVDAAGGPLPLSQVRQAGSP